MKARQVVWSDKEVQQLTNQFVPVADELHSLRKGSTPEAKFFQQVFDQKQQHPGHQGVFVSTPSGRLLASSTSYEAKQVMDTLQKGLSAWKALSEKERLHPKSVLVGETSVGRPEDYYPNDGLALRVTARDLHVDGLDGPRNKRWHRYYLWFNRDEVASMLPTEWKQGAQSKIPQSLAQRIAALALLDKGEVDGFTHAFKISDIQLADIQLIISQIDESLVEFKVVGQTSTMTRDAQPFMRNLPRRESIPDHRGVQTEILGEATYDRSQRRFKSFEMIAVGHRFGGAYVSRGPKDWGPSPIGFSFVMGRDVPAERLAPEFPERYPWLGE